MAAVSVFGGLGGPGHTLPTAHGGMFLTREGAPLRSPGDMAVTHLRRVRYVSSPTRQAEEDYAIFFQVCRQLTATRSARAGRRAALRNDGGRRGWHREGRIGWTRWR
jgi:hypothetical protein